MTKQERQEKIEYLEEKVKDFESKIRTELINGMPIVGTETMLKHFKAMLDREKAEYQNDDG
jgi:hypothetical protein